MNFFYSNFIYSTKRRKLALDSDTFASDQCLQQTQMQNAGSRNLISKKRSKNEVKNQTSYKQLKEGLAQKSTPPAERFEHRRPFSFGGETQFANLAHYCPTHNQLTAIQVFGKNEMKYFISSLR